MNSAKWKRVETITLFTRLLGVLFLIYTVICFGVLEKYNLGGIGTNRAYYLYWKYQGICCLVLSFDLVAQIFKLSLPKAVWPWYFQALLYLSSIILVILIAINYPGLICEGDRHEVLWTIEAQIKSIRECVVFDCLYMGIRSLVYSAMLLPRIKAGRVKEAMPAEMVVAEETMVPDELIKQYPQPSEQLQRILQALPETGILLYLYTKHCNISKEWKFWAMDLMENGLQTPGVIQLAGEDLDKDYEAFTNLLESIFRELGVDVNHEVFYCAYVLSIAQDVLRGERTAYDGFEVLSRAAIETNYAQPFRDFYDWEIKADEIVYRSENGSSLRIDNVEEWMHQYFEKLVKANSKYCTDSALTQDSFQE